MTSRVALAWLAHPVSIAGLALLLVNDHVLKQQWPGFVTGKLSDVAAMVMFPPLLATLVAMVLPRIRPRTLAVVALSGTGGVLFLIKFWGYGAQLASSVLTVVSGPSLVRADPTDLLALPALALAWLAFRRARPLTDRTAALVRAVVLLPLALLGTTATSCGADHRPPGIVGKSSDGSVWLKSPASDGDYEYLSTSDGGLTFRRGGPDGFRTLEEDCVQDTCYRVVRGDLRVEQLVLGSWTTAWRLDPGRKADLVTDRASCADPQGDRFESQALVVIPQAGGGHVVLVSNGADGLLRRDASGTWTRVGWGEDRPPGPLSQGVVPGGNTGFVVATVVLILLAGGLGVVAIKVKAPWRLSRWVVGFVVTAFSGAALDQAVTRLGDSAPAALVYGALAVTGLALGVGVAAALRYRPYLHPGWTTAMVLLIGGLAYLAEVWRHTTTIFIGGGFGSAGIVVVGFIVVALMGLSARRHPRQIG